MSEALLASFTQPQAFDSEQLGRPVVRLAPAIAEHPERLRQETAAWRRGGVWLASLRLLAERAAGCEDVLAEHGFRRIETLVTFERSTAAPPPAVYPVERATREDGHEAIAIARSAFRYDRYHADPLVPNAAADRLKGAWVANSLAGRAEAVLVARWDGRVAGFVTLMQTAEAGVIDLVATAPAAQGRGIGRALVAASLAFVAGRRPRLRVATQADNVASQRLYRGCGFAEVARQATYHWVNPELAR
ncbi:MAG: GNAT family N-acetyltransferase [Alphaproteobacteria bacterium]|nr:GNAT family N-acetyltransferase [Alphaproteobacteria bacterium]